jgi:hypothetical protein
MTARHGGGPFPGRPRLGGRRTPETWLTPPPPAKETNFKRFGIK